MTEWFYDRRLEAMVALYIDFLTHVSQILPIIVYMGPIVLLTDFAARDGYVGMMKGVIRQISPQVEIIDLSHDIPPQDVGAARFILWQSYRYFPAGSIFVTVVDPGVGSSRRILCVKTAEYTFLAPENGVLDFILSEQKVETMLSVENEELPLKPLSRTFHGRDIFAPTAAHLSRGIPLSLIGPLITYRLPERPFSNIVDVGVYPGQIIHIDHFGNLITNLALKLTPTYADVRFDNLGTIPFHNTYSEVAPGEALALKGSHGLVEVAVRDGHAAQMLNKSRGDELVFRFEQVAL